MNKHRLLAIAAARVKRLRRAAIKEHDERPYQDN